MKNRKQRKQQNLVDILGHVADLQNECFCVLDKVCVCVQGGLKDEMADGVIAKKTANLPVGHSTVFANSVDIDILSHRNNGDNKKRI